MNDKYSLLFKQIKAIINKDLPLVSNLSNASSLLYKIGDVNWAGFYLIKNNQLYLGPFQGDVACTIIPFGKGVCGKAAEAKKCIIVDDVNKFDGHIACSSISKSEIVVPIIKNNVVVGVIDIDSPTYFRFNEEDKELLEKISNLLKELNYEQ